MDLDDPCVAEGAEGAFLLDGAEAARGYGEAEGLLELRHKDRLLLKVRIAADLADRIELRSTSPVGIPASDDRSPLGYVADFGHRFVGPYAIIARDNVQASGRKRL